MIPVLENFVWLFANEKTTRERNLRKSCGEERLELGLYTSQLPEIPSYLVTSNPQIVRGNLDHWRVKRVGHGSAGRNDSRINREIRNSNSKRRLGVSLQYIPKHKTSEA